MPEQLRLAVCLYPLVTALDFQGPIELLGFLDAKWVDNPEVSEFIQIAPSHLLDIVYLSDSKEPVTFSSGPKAIPDHTYEEELQKGTQYDILLIPGGPGSRNPPPSSIEFLKRQAPKAKYILSVCTGSWLLGQAGVLDGKKATTNKASFKILQNSPSEGKDITWVAKARWVVDGNIWTSSGVTAGIDMAYAFLVHLEGEEIANKIKAVVEVIPNGQGDDPFAKHFQLG